MAPYKTGAGMRFFFGDIDFIRILFRNVEVTKVTAMCCDVPHDGGNNVDPPLA